MEKLWDWIIFASDRVDEKDQYCVRWFSNLYLIPSSQLSLMASHQQVTAISSLKYHFRASQCCETEQICKYALSSFQVLVLGELMRWNIANNANIQMMSLLIFKCFPLSRGKKRKLQPFSEENLCIKFFFRRKRVWRDLRLLRQITLSWAPLTTASLRHSDLQNFAMLTGVYGRRWRMLLWNCVFAKEPWEEWLSGSRCLSIT